MSRSNKKPTPQGFNAESYVRPGLSINEIVEIKEAFDYFDEDGSGEVSVKEFADSLRRYGFDTQNPEIFQIIADMDEDGSLHSKLRNWIN